MKKNPVNPATSYSKGEHRNILHVFRRRVATGRSLREKSGRPQENQLPMSRKSIDAFHNYNSSILNDCSIEESMFYSQHGLHECFGFDPVLNKQ